MSCHTLRALVPVVPRRLSQFWNPSGEKNTWENEKPLSKDLCRAEKVEAWTKSSLPNTWVNGANLVELVLKLGLSELNCDVVENQDYF